METVKEYRQRAQECRVLARTASADQRRKIEEMAETWEWLAETREASLQRNPEKPDAVNLPWRNPKRK